MHITVKLSVRNLVEFVLRSGSIDSRFSGTERALEGGRIHRRLQKEGGEAYRAEVALKATRSINDIEYILNGRADGIFTENGQTIIDEIKTTDTPIEMLTASYSPLHWAQAKCYGAFLCESEKLESAVVQLTYYQIDTDEIIRHQKQFTKDELENFLNDTLLKYEPWAIFANEHQQKRTNDTALLKFPFAEYRKGQYELARAVYKTIDSGFRLAAVAPTGIGKTMSTLFPAIKAMGENKTERIFYLTAKTITRKAAEDALDVLRDKKNPDIKSLTLTAKDKICFLDTRECTPDACIYANGYYDRINDALLRFLRGNNIFTKENIEIFAKENKLCPFELALDLSLFCDVIICDYNYLFDPVVRLKRFFDVEKGDYVFLVDEAHNLSERARSMYSARLNKADFYAVKKALGKKKSKLSACFTELNNAFIEMRHECGTAHEILKKEPDKTFIKAILAFNAVCSEWLCKNKGHELHGEILALYFETRFFMRIYEFYSDNYVTIIFTNSNDVSINLSCLDASSFIDKCLSLGKASVLFSATLSPLNYFIKTLGLEGCKRIVLDSPFPTENLCLVSAEHISTKFTSRTDSLDEVCKLIYCAICAKAGNYIVFFPSYKYLNDVCTRFSELYPAINTHVQESKMDENARDEYLRYFNGNTEETLVGFCVLGGIFSEGIDLVGDRLIGSIIVGVGLPQISTQQNALRDYYENTIGDGFAYAYQYPGFNKVLQAAGRVIRTATDKGIVLLIDSRYASERYKQLFPEHWRHCASIHHTDELKTLLDAFWS
ncbi:MAG: ATP-dependent DNA helicase [Oscillospiraceae bacterium]